MFEHGDHMVERLEDTIRVKVDEVKKTLEPLEQKLTELQNLKEELTQLKSMTPMVDKQDTLIKDIKDHAQKCVDHIVKWNEDLKKQVKMDYKIIQEIPESLEKVSEAVREVQEAVNRARKILSETELRPGYLDQLIPLQKDLKAIAEVGDNIEGREFRKKLYDLDRANHCFMPEGIQADYMTRRRKSSITQCLWTPRISLFHV
jgi:DNA repair ATPase RecN